MADGLLSGLTVIELADRRNQYLGKLLADGGARVIQVEPLAGSAGRWCGPFVADEQEPNRCLDYWYYNTGKSSICVDLSRPSGQDIVRGLAAEADIFIESYPQTQLQEWRLDYQSLARATLDKIIQVSVTDFGQDGPWKDYLANDVSHLALGGPMSSSGYSDPTASPMGGHGHQAWHVAGVLGLQGTIMALVERIRSGTGQYVDCSIHDCVSIVCEGTVPNWVFSNTHLYRQTGQHAARKRLAQITLPAADGNYVNTVATDMTQYLWVNVLKWMQELGVAGELEDPQYMDPEFRAVRWKEGSEIREGFARLLQKVPAEEAMLRAQSHQLTWVVVRAPEENLDTPHFNQRGFFVPISHPEVGKSIRYPRGPYLCDTFPSKPQGRAPNLGEHTDAVLREHLHFGVKEISALRAAEVVR